MEIRRMIEEIRSRVGEGGIDSVFFVACGGSIAGLYPAWYLISHEAKKLRTSCYNSNEFVYATPKACGPQSIVICCSLMSTPETVDACKKARELGAQVIALVGQKDADMTKIAQHSIPYQGYDARKRDTSIVQTKHSIALRLAFEILNEFEGCEFYDKALESFDLLDSIVQYALHYTDRRTSLFAKKTEHEKIIYVMGSGANNGVVYASSICNLLECMWTDSIVVNTGEYFHGPFEMTDQNLAVMLIIGSGRTRPMDERALTFLKLYCDNLTVIDMKTFGIDRLDKSVGEYFDPVICMPVMDIYNTALANLRGHDEKDRRYMHKMPY